MISLSRSLGLTARARRVWCAVLRHRMSPWRRGWPNASYYVRACLRCGHMETRDS